MKPRSDLGIRTLSGVVMMLICAGALLAGGWIFGALVSLVGIGVFWEWMQLVRGFTKGELPKLIWDLVGICYVGLACTTLLALGGVLGPVDFRFTAFALILSVIGTDVGAYFSGRTFGGPKIAHRISPSKTWSGLIGGMFGAVICLLLWAWFASGNPQFDQTRLISFAIHGIVVAIVAQAGDFFESWMKRRAGVKDSGNLIPGHGGLFDRTDGLLGVSFVTGLLSLDTLF